MWNQLNPERASQASPLPAKNVRRDCEPHRGPPLQLLAGTSMFLGLLSLCVLLPSVVAFPLGVCVSRMACKDLEKMHLGVMDPDGKEQAGTARAWALNGLVLCILSWVVWAFLLYHLRLGF
jgi:hypothetical protein